MTRTKDWYERHRIASRKHSAKMMARGLCRHCGRVLDGSHGTRCRKCHAKALVRGREEKKRTALARLCRNCRSPEIVTLGKILHCKTCWFKMMAQHKLGTAKRWRELRSLWDSQNGRCAYTGRELVIGVNASIDHILPSSRFPAKIMQLSNLCWADRKVNEIKRDMTRQEFLDLCAVVLEYAKR